MREIALTQGQVALVDDEDWEEVMKHAPWFLDTSPRSRTEYAVAKVGHGRKGARSIWMHQVVLGIDPDGRTVDHRNRNGLDNRRENLRWATRTQQRWNQAMQRTSRSVFKGVQHIQGRYWTATIQAHGKRTYLGCFPTAEQAARAYDAKARELHGDFAYLNFPSAPMTGATR